MRATHRLILLSLVCRAFAEAAFAAPTPAPAGTPILAGTATGIYRVIDGRATSLRETPEVRKILRAGDRWLFLTGVGILESRDLVLFEERNAGLPVKVVKVPEAGSKRFVREVQELKDLEVHPDNPDILVTATRDAVFLSRDGGRSWKNEGMSAATAGVKAVSVADLPDSTGAARLTIFMSHPIYGVSWKRPDEEKAAWRDIVTGLEKMPSIKWPDEVADIVATRRDGVIEILASQTFIPRVYRLDWPALSFVPVWSGADSLGTVESLSRGARGLVFSSPGELRELALPQADDARSPEEKARTARAGATPVTDLASDLSGVGGNLLSAWFPAAKSRGRGDVSLSELWLLKPERRASPYAARAAGRKGNYLPVHQVTTMSGLERHIKTLVDNGLDTLVVDMKDDYGFLRYNSTDPLVTRLGKAGKGIDVEAFVKKTKESGLYLVARIVVFKDRELARHGGGKYAVWDRRENKAWQGFEYETKKIETTAGDAAETETARKYYDEFWVDPYSEAVWEYNVAISKELIARGFDEIQFDYIRFPTDGKNLGDTQYRWQDPGMDKESALMSFLSYARREIAAPISIDIYGANGWYRTGARTGQDVELLARYVDAICPMFYPSHFEQGFLAQEPAQDRPYRIFYHGSYRNAIIARNHIVVRPWAQAFYLNVSYDRAWYSPDYVQRQAFGARDSINQGYTYWNNSGRYADLRPDAGTLAPYPWTSPNESPSPAIPFFGERGAK